jgi:hypothetical protein
MGQGNSTHNHHCHNHQIIKHVSQNATNYKTEAGWFGAKVGSKVLMNTIVPGSGSIVDLCDSVACYSRGDIVGGTLSLGFGLMGFIPFVGGTISGAGDIFKGSVDTARETGKLAAKAMTKELGKQVGKQIAQGANKAIIVEGAKTASQLFGPQIYQEAASQAFKQTQKTLLKEAAIKTIQEAGKVTITIVVNEASQEVANEAAASIGLLAGKTLSEMAKEAIKNMK